MNVIIFDALDTIVGYKGAPLGESKLFYQQRLAIEHSMQIGQMLQTVPYETQLEWTVRLYERGDLEPIPLDGSLELLEYFSREGLDCRIVTADIPEGAAYTAKSFLDAGLITSDKVHAIARLGSKIDVETWTNTQRLYFPDASISSVFEDTRVNLDAAVLAYKTIGFLVINQRKSGRVTQIQAKSGLEVYCGSLKAHLSNLTLLRDFDNYCQHAIYSQRR